MVLAAFPPFCPDQSNFSPNATDGTVNAKPQKDGWGPLKSLNAFSEALPAAIRGACAVKDSSGVWQTFAGTSTNLYKLDTATLAWTEISRTTDDYLLPDGAYWSFALFGSTLIATALGSTYPQFVDIETSNDFANLTNATFEAERVCVVGDFVVFARIDGDNRTVKWSGVNDPTYWTVAQRGSDEQILPDGGDIEQIIAQAQQAIIIQNSMIRQMVFDPASGVVFRFGIINPERGSIAPRSVANIGPGDFVYLAKDGFYRGVDGKPIGAERVDHWFFRQCAADKVTQVAAGVDPFDKLVWWRFEDENGASAMLGYDWQLDRWCYSTEAPVEMLSAATGGYTLEQLDAFGTLETLPFSLDSDVWKGGLLGFAGFDADNMMGFFDGPNLEAVIESEDKAPNFPRRAITGRVTPIVDADDSEVDVGSKETQNGTLTYVGYAAQMSGQPFVNTRVGGRWHRFRVKRPAASTWKNATGIEFEFTDGGSR